MTWSGTVSRALLCLALIVPAGCGFMPGGYYYEQWHANDPGLHSVRYNLGDVNGEVGHRFAHTILRADCQPRNNWTYDLDLVSGSLPPGLSFDPRQLGDIIGIPAERGHWIAQLAISNFTCNGERWSAWDGVQEIRFHISGTGRVIN